MPKKSRKGRAKYKGRRRPKLARLNEVTQHPQALPLQSKEVPLAKSPITIGGRADRLRHVPQELRRIAIIAGALFVLLIVLYLLLR